MGATESVHVAVCIVAFNNPEDVMACLSALSATTYPSFQVVICENGSADSYRKLESLTQSYGSDHRIVRVLHAPGNPGYAGGVNLCIGAALDADAWWVLNPDTQPEPQALGALVARLSDGDVQAVGGPVYYSDGLVQALGGKWSGRLGSVTVIGNGSPVDARVSAREIEAAMNFIHGASLLLGGTFLETVGPMREDYFLYGEEVEWCLRAIKRGMRLGFAPEARVLHAQGSTTGLSRNVKARPWLPIYLDERNKLLLVRDTSPLLLATAVPATLMRIIARYGRKRAWRQLGFATSGWWAGIRAERGKPRRLTGR